MRRWRASLEHRITGDLSQPLAQLHTFTTHTAVRSSTSTCPTDFQRYQASLEHMTKRRASKHCSTVSLLNYSENVAWYGSWTLITADTIHYQSVPTQLGIEQTQVERYRAHKTKQFQPNSLTNKKSAPKGAPRNHLSPKERELPRDGLERASRTAALVHTLNRLAHSEHFGTSAAQRRCHHEYAVDSHGIA